MKEGNVVLTPLPQADGKIKNRPAIFLREMPPFQDILVCGVSTQVHQLAPDFDEIITRQDSDFSTSGLKRFLDTDCTDEHGFRLCFLIAFS
jgi:mRNA interferase MazF